MLAIFQSRRKSQLGFTREEVVDALYRGLLGRFPEPPGLVSQLDALDRGAQLHEIVQGVARSREYFEMWQRSGNPPALATQAWRSASRHAGEPHIFFLHIMKTGGTALVEGLSALAGDRFCLTQIFQDHLLAAPAVVVESASLVAGHLGIEARDLLPEGTVTATTLRDPLDRVLSHYAHVLVDPALKSETDGLTLEEFVHSPRWRPLCENFQARNLVHRIGLADIWRRRSPDEMLARIDPQVRPVQPKLLVQALFESGPLGIPDPELCRRSLAALDTIEHVGVSDRLDLLFTSLARIWGVDQPPRLPVANASAHRLRTSEVPRRLRDEILEANAADLALYEQARVRAEAVGSSMAGQPSVHGAAHPAAVSVAAATVVPAGGPALAAAPVPERSRRWRIADEAGAPPPWLQLLDRWGLTLAVVLSAVVVGLDLMLNQQVILMDLLVVGPSCALFTGNWRATAAVGGAVVVMGNLLAASDGIWATVRDLTGLVTLTVVSLSATAAAALMQRNRHRQAPAAYRPSSV